MSAPPHRSFCAAHPQTCARMRDSLSTVVRPLRLAAARIRKTVAARGLVAVAADLDQAGELLDELERRIHAYFDAQAAAPREDAEQFCRRVRHDLRNPVGALASYLELAADGARNGGQASLADAVEAFRDDVVDMLDTVDSVVRPG